MSEKQLSRDELVVWFDGITWKSRYRLTWRDNDEQAYQQIRAKLEEKTYAEFTEGVSLDQGM